MVLSWLRSRWYMLQACAIVRCRLRMLQACALALVSMALHAIYRYLHCSLDDGAAHVAGWCSCPLSMVHAASWLVFLTV